MRVRFLGGLIFLVFSFNTFSQNVNDYFEKHLAASIQKLYLNTDREFYFIGDTLWFASYLVDGNNHVPVQGDRNLNIELINNNGQIILHEFFSIFNGFGQGYLSFENDTIKEGNYLLRSYTDDLRSFGEDCFFYKKIKISESKNRFEFSEQEESGSDQSDINIDFFPEGGFLLAENVNQIAFEVTGLQDNEKDITGMIMDEKGNVIQFSTLYNGMGKLFFIPEQNSIYSVKLNGILNKEWKLPVIRNEGAKIIATFIHPEYVNLSILHTELYSDKDFNIIIMHRGKGLFSMPIDAEMLNKTIKLSNDYFGEGINRVILLNQNFEPVSERLIFMEKSEGIGLNLELTKDTLRTRDEVSLIIKDTGNLQNGENAGLSVVVVNNNALNSKGITQNIKSYLLIDSELKGFINDPADFFKEDEKITSLLKLDLLMLTQGWTNYVWNDLENKNVEFDNPKSGLNFSGKLFNKTKRKIVANSEVLLGFNSKNKSQLFNTTTDNKGNFKFENIFYTDTAIVYIQGRNKKDKLLTAIELDTVISLPEINVSSLNNLKKFEDIPQSLYRLNYLNELKLTEFYPDRDSKLLEEVKVRGKKPKEDDGHYRIYSLPSNSLKVTNKDFGYTNILQYLQGRVAGLQIVRDRVIIRGQSSLTGSNEPLYILDGIQISKDMVMSISMSGIDKIEVLKGADAAIFGSRGSCGVISILSKRAEFFTPVAREIPGTIIKRIKGFAPFREFYSPRYSSDNLFSENPDYRTTLYWNPHVLLINGKADVSFFTCDNLSEYTIFVEGITENGRTCLGSIGFVVYSYQKRSTGD